jgi:hypothetical protein
LCDLATDARAVVTGAGLAPLPFTMTGSGFDEVYACAILPITDAMLARIG